MAGSLEGPLAKLARADRQFVALKNEVETIWPPGKAWPVRTEIDRGGLEYRFYLGEIPHIESEWTLAIGEILFDLRSALDHLAFQLHVRRFKGKVPRKVEKASQFPIYREPADWGKYLYRIKNLSKTDQSALHHLQPYNARHDCWEDTRRALFELSTIHNIDKHRKLHVVASTQRAAMNVARIWGFEPEWKLCWGALESHSCVDTWTFPEKPPSKVPDHSGAKLHVALEYGNEYLGLLTFLQRLSTAVRAVIERFSDRFPPL